MAAGLHSGAVTAKTLVAHRGASAYAPEHTLASYRLAVQQHADYVEQDLAVTKDLVLICLHDDSLERTTNVKRCFRIARSSIRRPARSSGWRSILRWPRSSGSTPAPGSMPGSLVSGS